MKTTVDSISGEYITHFRTKNILFPFCSPSHVFIRTESLTNSPVLEPVFTTPHVETATSQAHPFAREEAVELNTESDP